MKLNFLLITILCGLLGGCRFGEPSVTIVLQSISPHTTSKTPIYIAGNFNDWDPKDNRYRLNWLGGEKFGLELKLPETFQDSVIEYKYTRGSWAKVEVDREGNDLPNRTLPYRKKSLTALDRIEGWAVASDQRKDSTALPSVHLFQKALDAPELDTTKQVWVCLPEGYEQGKERYPVVYLQDGQNLFDKATSAHGEWKVDEAMVQLFRRKALSAIVVGIAHGGDERLNEYSSYKNEAYGGGKGQDYLRFVATTLKPKVDSAFRTLPGREHTAIGGSSMGALIALEAGINHPELFSKLLLFSPSLWFNPTIEEEVAKLESEAPMRVFLLMGDQEGENQKERDAALTKFEALAEQLGGLESVTLKKSIVPGGKHNENLWGTHFPKALGWLFQEPAQ